MKILIVQLARLGDIYQTWPLINAMLRQWPDRELHLLVRERFVGATTGLDPRVRIHELPTASILAPFLRDVSDINTTQSRLNQFADSLGSEGFDKVINLSFSPFSSYLTSYLEQAGAVVAGYSRHKDGFFNIPDDVSAYFYAQVGINRWNRYHLSEIFASVAGVTLSEDDWKISGRLPFFERVLPSNYVVLHVGASQEEKSWPSHRWMELISKLIENTQHQIVLVGGNGEDRALRGFVDGQRNRIVNLVGKTRVCDLLFIAQWADVCVGGDSVVMHAASLTNTPCLNLSCQHVNFWETGPVASGSQVIWESEMADISVDQVFTGLKDLLENPRGESGNIRVTDGFSAVKYTWRNQAGSDFEWGLIRAIYTGEDFPLMEDPVSFQAFYRLRELSELAIGVIGKLSDQENPGHAFVQQMDSLDMAMQQVGDLNPAAGILYRWFATEKLRIPPMAYPTLVETTLKIYTDLNSICRVFVGDDVYHFKGGEIYAE